MTASPLDHAAEIAAWFAAAGLDELELTGPGGKLRLRRGEPGATPGLTAPDLIAPDLTAPDLTAPDLTAPGGIVPGGAPEARAVGVGRGRGVVSSPGVGVFLRAHPLRDEPLVRPGDRVADGQVLGLLRIGSLLVPVVAPRPGVVEAVPAADGTLVGFGDRLVELAQPG